MRGGCRGRSTRGLVRAAVVALAALMTGCQAREVVKISEYPAEGRVVTNPITLVVWNAQKGGSERFEPDLARLVITEEPDLVLLQEARADLLTTKRIGGHFASSWSYPWPNGTVIGLLTLSNAPPSRIQPIPSRHKEFFVTAPKLSLATEYPLADGQTLLAINVHLLAFERWTTTGIGAQMEDLAALMQAHEGPIILAGDFNTWSQERLDLVEGVVRDLGLTEVTGFSSERSTGDKEWGLLNWLFGIDEELPLDRVYLRGLTYHSAKVLPYESSDHRALRVILELSREQAGISTGKNDKP